MQPISSVRRSSFNTTPPAISSPTTFVVIASRIVSDDRLEVVLRGEHLGDFAGAKRHALVLLQAVVHRFDARACVDVTDGAGAPLFSCSTTPATVIRAGEPDAVYSGLRCLRCGWFLSHRHGTTCPICAAAGWAVPAGRSGFVPCASHKRAGGAL